MQSAQKTVDAIYDDFLNKVSEGREIDMEQVSSLAEGKIWLGYEAVDNGLADSLGGLVSAINIARDLAELDENYTIQEFPKFLSLKDTILESFQSNTKQPTLNMNKLSSKLPIIRDLQMIDGFISKHNDPQHIYSRLSWLNSNTP